MKQRTHPLLQFCYNVMLHISLFAMWTSLPLALTVVLVGTRPWTSIPYDIGMLPIVLATSIIVYLALRVMVPADLQGKKLLKSYGFRSIASVFTVLSGLVAMISVYMLLASIVSALQNPWLGLANIAPMFVLFGSMIAISFGLMKHYATHVVARITKHRSFADWFYDTLENIITSIRKYRTNIR